MVWKGFTIEVKILVDDIGTGTQDVMLFDSDLNMENNYKLILPSPTMQVFHKIKAATSDRVDILLTGNLMGGGPSGWAARAHLNAGLRVFSTPNAARSFDDDLQKISQMGIQIISEDEATSLPCEVRRIAMIDFDFSAITRVFTDFNINVDGLTAIAVSVFDHGNAPVDESDRKFRFDYLDSRIRADHRLSAFAYLSNRIPTSMTRLQSVATGAGELSVPLVVMDSAPAAILGALFDPRVRTMCHKVIVNVGNLHTLAFRMNGSTIEGLFEHHTGALSQDHLESLLYRLASGELSNEEVFNEHGHGALVYAHEPWALGEDSCSVVVTGPRRNKMLGSSLNPYFAVPFGDMMTTGCVGLLAAVADVLPQYAEPILDSLTDLTANHRSPWECV